MPVRTWTWTRYHCVDIIIIKYTVHVTDQKVRARGARDMDMRPDKVCSKNSITGDSIFRLQSEARFVVDELAGH